MKSIEIDIGGPLMPRSKSRAMVRSLVSFGFSRWPIPGGRTQAEVSLSLSHAAVRLPRLAPMAWWIGASTWRGTNTAPTRTSGATRSSPRCTAPTRPPMAMANSTGRSPRSKSTAHQATARMRSACTRIPKNCPLGSSAKACDHRCGPPSVSTRFLASSDPATSQAEGLQYRPLHSRMGVLEVGGCPGEAHSISKFDNCSVGETDTFSGELVGCSLIIPSSSKGPSGMSGVPA